MNATAERDTDTYQRVETDSPEWKKLLRRIIKDRGNHWTARASAPDWQITFNRFIPGELGEPDCNVRIGTDCRIAVPNDSQFGTRQSFTDSTPVIVPKPSRVFLRDSQTAITAHLLLHGARLAIEPSSGSTSSSAHGLATVALAAEWPAVGYGNVDIGTTTYINGRQVCSGPCE